MTLKPLLAITMGDPAGIGPEVTLKAFRDAGVAACCRCVVVGDVRVMRAEAARLGFDSEFHAIDEADLRSGLPEDGIIVLDRGGLAELPAPGQQSAETGAASLDCIMTAISLANAGHFAGVVTAPISKKALELAGSHYPGHTEIFADETRTRRYAMLMYSERMAVALVTCHQPLASVPDALTSERIAKVGQLLHETLQDLRGQAPRIAVLGLNPHAGEDGVLGTEDRDIITPAIAALRKSGIDADGPLPPDTAFTPNALERYDGHLCMYHDQGLIPFKMLCMEEGVNMTMGLPFIRTSPDHGTAFDIAGKGVASPSSMISAIRLAGKIAGSRGGTR